MKCCKLLVLAGLMLVGEACLVGCATMPPSQVLGMPGRDVVDLSPDDVVRVMLRAGFDRPQILELGTDLRNALASSGGASIRLDDRVEALLSVEGLRLYVSSRLRGSFIYDLQPGPTTQPATPPLGPIGPTIKATTQPNGLPG